MTTDRLIAALGRRGGLATVTELAEATGFTTRTVRSRASRSGCWLPFPGVVGLPLVTPDRRDWIRAAALHAAGLAGSQDRGRVAVTRLSALYLLGVGGSAPTKVHLVIPQERRLRPHARLAVSRSTYLCPDDVAVHDRVPVLRGAALLRDLAAVRDLNRLRGDAIALVHRGLCTIDDIGRLLRRDRGFPGCQRLSRVADELSSAGRVDSVLELQARRRFADDGIHFDHGQVAVPSLQGDPSTRPIHLDLGILAVRFGIEVDSMAFHSSPDALRRDAGRANRVAAQLEDWRVLHLTWQDLGEGWPAFLSLTRKVISDQSRRHLGRDWPRRRDLRLA